MDAEQVRKLVAAMYPQAMSSPLAQLFAGVAAQDEAIRAIDLAQITATAERNDMLRAARRHAEDCMEARDGWEVETLGFNIESNFPDLTADECDEIAAHALGL